MKIENHPDYALFEALTDLADIHSDQSKLTLAELNHVQKKSRNIHTEHDTLLKELHERESTSTKIDYVVKGSSGFVLFAGLIGFIATGGSSTAILGGLAALSSATGAFAQAANTLIGFKTSEKQANALALKEIRALDKSKLESLLLVNHESLQKVAHIYKALLEIVRNQNLRAS